MTQRIQMIQRVETPYKYTRPDAVKINPKKKYLWLQKICFGIMKKLGCLDEAIACKVTTEVIEDKKFINELLKQHEAHFRWRKNRPPDTILIGVEEYNKIMCSSWKDEMFHFQTELWQNNTMFGMKVIVLPQMKGMIVLDSSEVFK